MQWAITNHPVLLPILQIGKQSQRWRVLPRPHAAPYTQLPVYLKVGTFWEIQNTSGTNSGHKTSENSVG